MYSIKDWKGKEVDPSEYDIDLKKKTFSSRVYGLVLDFKGLDGWSFDTLWDCKFITGNNCKFDVGYDCTFITGDNCEFKTNWNCVFNIGNNSALTFELTCLLNNRLHNFKLNKGLHVVSEEDLYKDVDCNWAILNHKHDDEFVREVCKDILEGYYNG